MFKKSVSSLLRISRAGRARVKNPRRDFKPVTEPLEGRDLPAAAIALSAVQQLGIPSVFAIGSTGNVSYDFLTLVNGQPQFAGWTQVGGQVGATSISSGTALEPGSSVPRPFVFLINTAQDVYFNSINTSGTFNGWSPVGLNVGAVSISSGTLPLTNTPFVVLINGNHDIYYNSQASSGVWTGWNPVGVGVGAVSVATGVVQTSLSPTIYEPYVFMTNTAHNVYYSVRQTNGAWSQWSPVGVGVGAVSISATTISNKPTVSMLNTAGNIYINSPSQSGAWLGWLPVGMGTGSGATPADASTAIVSSFNNYEFALNTSGQLFSAYGVYGHWSAWGKLNSLASGVTSVAITATSAPTNVPFAFAIGTDGNVYWADQLSWANWSSFASLGAPK
jgi:hypothetical protein